MATNPRDITFVIPGQAQPVGATRGRALGTLKASVHLGTQRGGGEPLRIAARSGEDVVVLTLAKCTTRRRTNL